MTNHPSLSPEAVLCRFSPADGQLCGHVAADPESPAPLCSCHIASAIADLYFAHLQSMELRRCER